MLHMIRELRLVKGTTLCQEQLHDPTLRDNFTVRWEKRLRDSSLPSVRLLVQSKQIGSDFRENLFWKFFLYWNV